MPLASVGRCSGSQPPHRPASTRTPTASDVTSPAPTQHHRPGSGAGATRGHARSSPTTDPDRCSVGGLTYAVHSRRRRRTRAGDHPHHRSRPPQVSPIGSCRHSPSRAAMTPTGTASTPSPGDAPVAGRRTSWRNATTRSRRRARARAPGPRRSPPRRRPSHPRSAGSAGRRAQHPDTEADVGLPQRRTPRKPPEMNPPATITRPIGTMISSAPGHVASKSWRPTVGQPAPEDRPGRRQEGEDTAVAVINVGAGAGRCATSPRRARRPGTHLRGSC